MKPFLVNLKTNSLNTAESVAELILSGHKIIINPKEGK